MSVKLHAIRAGAVVMDMNIFVPTTPKGNRVNMPVPIYVISHPRGQVLVDTGVDPEAFVDPVGVWGGVSKACYPQGTREDGVIPRLMAAGFPPQEIKQVVMTHLHMDHAGGNRFLPWATFLVQRAELEAARDPAQEGQGYFRRDWDHPLQYKPLDGQVDLFGDGLVRLQPLPGHTPGFQAVVLQMEGGTVILAGDTCYTEQNLTQHVAPRMGWNSKLLLNCYDWLMEQQRQGAFLVYGHDPVQWPAIARRFPAQH